MSGIVTFQSLAEAIRQGYQVYQNIPEGYLVRTRTPSGMAFALVILKRS
jgi:hypothetical protein